jgi:hypothetical protein
LTNHDERVQPRKTALLVGAVLIALGGWNFYRGRVLTSEILGGSGVILLLLGLLSRRWSLYFHRAWMHLAAALGFVNSRIILSLVYYLAITPFGIVSRMMRRDPLVRRRSRESTYWIPRKTTRQARESFERSF